MDLARARTVADLPILGYRKDGRPIWPIMGGNGEGDPAGGAPAVPAAPVAPAPVPPPAQPAAPAAPATPQAPSAVGTLAQQGITPAAVAQMFAALQNQQPQQAPTVQQGEPDEGRDISRLPRWAQDHIRSLRDEAAGHRVRFKEADETAAAWRQRVAESFGLDPAEVTLEALDGLGGYLAQTAQDSLITTEAWKAAAVHGADPATLLNWGPFRDAAAQLDTTATDFAEQLGELVQTTVESTPILRAQQSQAPARAMPARSGVEIPGGTGTTQPLTESDLESMAASGRFEEIDKARREGRLAHLLGG